jgi:uncharacterized protein
MRARGQAKGQFGRFLRIVFPALVVVVTGFVALLVFLTYGITHPGAVQEAVGPSDYFLSADEVTWAASGGSELKGWWIPGKSSSTVLLALGYGMSRSDALTLAMSLHASGHNTLIYAQRGTGANPSGASSLGLHEPDDMAEALAYLKLRPQVDPKRLGIWGVDIGARAALRTAASHPEVRALALDSPYENVTDFLITRVREKTGYSNALIEAGCGVVFRLVHIDSFSEMGRPLHVDALSDRSILFIEGANRKDMKPLLDLVYDRMHPPVQRIVIPVSRVHLMNKEELSAYDRQVTQFFNTSLAKGTMGR